jgi:hypothetical protein
VQRRQAARCASTGASDGWAMKRLARLSLARRRRRVGEGRGALPQPHARVGAEACGSGLGPLIGSVSRQARTGRLTERRNVPRWTVPLGSVRQHQLNELVRARICNVIDDRARAARWSMRRARLGLRPVGERNAARRVAGARWPRWWPSRPGAWRPIRPQPLRCSLGAHRWLPSVRVLWRVLRLVPVLPR